MSFACRNCRTPITVPPGVDPARCRCAKCGIPNPLGPSVNQVPVNQAPMNPAPDANDPFDLAALERSATPLPQYPRPPQTPASQYGAALYGAPQHSAPQYGGVPQYGAPARPARSSAQSRRFRKRLFGYLALFLVPPCLCLVLVVVGAIYIRSYMAYQEARYAALNVKLDEFVNAAAGEYLDLDARRVTGEGQIKGKYVIIDKDEGKIHSFHDGSDPRMAWKAEEVQTVIWLRTRKEQDGYYIRDDQKDKVMPQKTIAYKETVTGTVIDLAAHRVVGKFRLDAIPPEEIRSTWSATASVAKKDVLARIRQIPSAG